jgi:hypothetical protein
MEKSMNWIDFQELCLSYLGAETTNMMLAHRLTSKIGIISEFRYQQLKRTMDENDKLLLAESIGLACYYCAAIAHRKNHKFFMPATTPPFDVDTCHRVISHSISGIFDGMMGTWDSSKDVQKVINNLSAIALHNDLDLDHILSLFAGELLKNKQENNK